MLHGRTTPSYIGTYIGHVGKDGTSSCIDGRAHIPLVARFVRQCLPPANHRLGTEYRFACVPDRRADRAYLVIDRQPTSPRRRSSFKPANAPLVDYPVASSAWCLASWVVSCCFVFLCFWPAPSVRAQGSIPSIHPLSHPFFFFLVLVYALPQGDAPIICGKEGKRLKATSPSSPPPWGDSTLNRRRPESQSIRDIVGLGRPRAFPWVGSARFEIGIPGNTMAHLSGADDAANREPPETSTIANPKPCQDENRPLPALVVRWLVASLA